MARSSPPTDRVVAVLNCLAGVPPDQGLPLSRIARTLGISTSTCGVVLTSLLNAGYVYRLPNLDYRLGMGLLPVVQALNRSLPILTVAESEIRYVVSRTGYACTLSMTDSEKFTVLYVEDSARRPPIGVRSGDTFPSLPPYGTVIFAFGNDSMARQWRKDAFEANTPDEAARFRLFLQDIRKTGYGAWSFEPLEFEAVRVLQTAIDELALRARDGRVREELLRVFERVRSGYLSEELRDRPSMSVSYLAVPVFDHAGSARYQLELHILERDLPAMKFWSFVEDLKSAAQRMTAALGGDWERARSEGQVVDDDSVDSEAPAGT